MNWNALAYNPVHIALILTSPVIREGIAAILRKCPRPVVVHIFDRLEEIGSHPAGAGIAIVIADPACIINRTREFAALKKLHPGITWIGFSYAIHDPVIRGCFNHHLQVSDHPETILNLVEQVANTVGAKPTDLMQETLSDREIDVLKLIVAGMSHKEIADRLNISIHTVTSHRKNISQKTGIKSQPGLVIYALTNKIVNLDEQGD